ncbi:MAG TPA: nucleoside-triphosphatase [Candidatus Deferrimicrobium sp.]|nr:nucleoside-triphosphatase [Candidatus Deferrimicrobium sp.]
MTSGATYKNLLITGLPGVGKTTVIRKLAEALQPLRPVGFYTDEIREGGIRKGFRLTGLDGSVGILSHIDFASRFRVGKYGVDVPGFERFLQAIDFASPDDQVVIIDEIGKVEFSSDMFRQVMTQLLDSEKIVVATIALKATHMIQSIKFRQDVRLIELTAGTRDQVLSQALHFIDERLRL